ncbi:MAG: hypothetical protein QXR69_00270 [Conexivisphaerales archaeon]
MITDPGKEAFPRKFIDSGSKELDTIIGGHLYSRSLVQFYGAAGTGKTQILLSYCQSYDQNHKSKILFIDTQLKFRPERLLELAKERNGESSILERIDVLESDDPRRIYETVRKACSEYTYGMICVDDLSEAFIRHGYDIKDTSMLALSARELSLWTMAQDKFALITDRVRFDPITRSEAPVGIRFTQNYTSTLIHLQKRNGYFRAMNILTGKTARFKITKKGVEDVAPYRG